MGLSQIYLRPEWMICQVLPVAPPAVRPSAKLDAQHRYEHVFSHFRLHYLTFILHLLNDRFYSAVYSLQFTEFVTLSRSSKDIDSHSVVEYTYIPYFYKTFCGVF